MEISTGITQYDMSYNLNAIDDYNKFLQNNTMFNFDSDIPTDFELALDAASKNYPIHDKHDPRGLGNFAGRIGDSIASGLNAVNNAKLEANRMQEDIAMGGPTSIHDAMIAAEKATLSMEMAIQVRNRILSAYTDITNMGI